MALLIGEHHNNRPILPGVVVTTRTLTRQAPVGQAQGHHPDIAEAAAVDPVVGQVVQGHPEEAASFYQRTI